MVDPWVRGTAAWLKPKSGAHSGSWSPVVIGGYRNNMQPPGAAKFRVRYVAVKDRDRVIEDVHPSRLAPWTSATAREERKEKNAETTLH